MVGSVLKKRTPKRPPEDFVSMPELPNHIFRAGDVGKILGIEKWRLEKFLTGKQYQLSASGQLGKGQGSWRLFSHQDIYRLGIANWMVRDGFAAKFISFVLREIEDSDLLDVDENGETRATDLGIFRNDSGPRVGPVSTTGKEQPYYILPLRQLIADIDKRILAHTKGE
jgi:hypothetical protein